ncbi:MAG: hypothetical protein JO139_08140 [Alphaproteobacteria bacterium]|nr:hypothetical protein [Alphaproteobacteria bacterium]
MIAIRALDGSVVDVDENAVTLVSGPYPHDVGRHTYVHGVDRGVLVTAEDAASLVARLGISPPLVKLTRPEMTPVWIKRSAVSAIRAPLPTEQQSPGAVRSVVILGDLHQAVHEELAAVEQVLKTDGAHV